MTKEELNSIIESSTIDGKKIDRKRLGHLLKISHPTLRIRLNNPDSFSVKEINDLGRILRKPKLLLKFLPKN